MAARRWASGFALFAAVGAFQPFAGVQEIAPRSLKDSCGARHAGTGLAKCGDRVRKTLEDGGTVELSWNMTVDPTTLLSVDTERLHGVKVLACSPGILDVELPEAYAAQATKGTLVVASRFAHSCGHLSGKHLYASVRSVDALQWIGQGSDRKAHARLVTNEARDFSHVVPSISFNFSYMPIEALQKDVRHPPVQTNFGQHEHGCHSPPCDVSAYRRRLEVIHRHANLGHPHASSDASGGASTVNSVLNFVPKQISNFGWNWDFFMNSTQEPEFAVKVPGMEASVKLNKPYITIHAGIFLNFTSHFESILTAPHVVWKAGIMGHGDINARMLVEAKTTGSVSEDPFYLFDLPALEKLKETQWLEKIDVALGILPVTVEPGFQFKADLYHVGTLDAGTLQIGGSTKFNMLPQISFDSLVGLTATVQADFEDPNLYPPLWIIAADNFEIGLMLEPTVWLRGQFGGTSNSEPTENSVGFELRPYLNYSISRGTMITDTHEMKSLIVYPFRIAGLSTENRKKKYSVELTVNGMTVTSSPEINWGEVEIHDHLGAFSLGLVPNSVILRKPILVKLFEVDDTDPDQVTRREIGHSTIMCNSILSGECHPNPMLARMVVDGTSVDVMVVALWKDNPVPWFASRIRGVSLAFPQVTLDQTAIMDAIPELKNGGTPSERLYLRVTHGHRTYVTELTGTSPELQGLSVIEFGPTFLETWLPCMDAVCADGVLQLYYGSTLLGSSPMPEIPWNSLPDLVVRDDATDQSGLGQLNLGQLFSSSGGSVQEEAQSKLLEAMQAMMEGVSTLRAPHTIPVAVSIGAAGPVSTHGHTSVGAIRMEAVVIDPGYSSVFLKPATFHRVSLSDSSTELVWTTAFVEEGKEYTFRLSPWKLVPKAGGDSLENAAYPGVGNMVLETVASAVETITDVCERKAIAEMQAGIAPCSFSHLMTFDGAVYAAGSRIIITVEWLEQGFDHVLMSPPLEMISGSRRLAERAAEAEQARAGRRLWTAEDWNQRLEANQASCAKEDLHMSVGFGMLARAVMQSSALPAISPLLGSVNERPLLSTGFKHYGSHRVMDTDLADLMPSWICGESNCQATMPGCTQAAASSFTGKHLPPVVVWSTSRAMLFDDLHVGREMIRTSLAYAFSVLPEVVDIVVEELEANATSITITTTPQSTTTGSLAWGDVSGSLGIGQTPLPESVLASSVWSAPTSSATVAGATASSQVATPVPSPAPPLALGGLELPAMFSPGRRLRSVPASPSVQQGVSSPGQSRLRPMKSRRIKMTFKTNVPFPVDRRMLEVMIKHKFFREIEDDLTKEGHGPVTIQDFEIINAGDVSGPPQRPWYLAYQPQGVGGWTLAAIPAGACFAALMAAIGVYVVKGKVYRRLDGEAQAARDIGDMQGDGDAIE